MAIFSVQRTRLVDVLTEKRFSKSRITARKYALRRQLGAGFGGTLVNSIEWDVIGAPEGRMDRCW